MAFGRCTQSGLSFLKDECYSGPCVRVSESVGGNGDLWLFAVLNLLKTFFCFYHIKMFNCSLAVCTCVCVCKEISWSVLAFSDGPSSSSDQQNDIASFKEATVPSRLALGARCGYSQRCWGSPVRQKKKHTGTVLLLLRLILLSILFYAEYCFHLFRKNVALWDGYFWFLAYLICMSGTFFKP